MDSTLPNESKIMLSVVIPVYNEHEVLPMLLPRLRKALSIIQSGHGDDWTYEIIFVDDGSTDGTLDYLREQRDSSKEIRIIRMATNQGHMNALTAGMSYSTGLYTLTMDADLQDPPEEIPEMYEKIISSKVNVVQAQRIDRESDSIAKRTSAGVFYYFISRLAKDVRIVNAGDFRILDETSNRILWSLREKNKVYRFLIPLLGMSVVYHEYKRESRKAGKTKYSIGKMVKLSLESALAFSTRPIRIFGLILVFAGFSNTTINFYFLIKGEWSRAFLGFLISLFLLSLAILFEYVGKIYETLIDRPPFTAIEERH